MELLDDDHILEFKYVTLEDDGEYTCEATNRGGTVRRSITLSLLGNIFVLLSFSLFMNIKSIILVVDENEINDFR
jgi:hypothetical protein